MSVFLDESLSVPVCKTNLKKKNYIGETTSDRFGIVGVVRRVTFEHNMSTYLYVAIL